MSHDDRTFVRLSFKPDQPVRVIIMEISLRVMAKSYPRKLKVTTAWGDEILPETSIKANTTPVFSSEPGGPAPTLELPGARTIPMKSAAKLLGFVDEMNYVFQCTATTADGSHPKAYGATVNLAAPTHVRTEVDDDRFELDIAGAYFGQGACMNLKVELSSDANAPAPAAKQRGGAAAATGGSSDDADASSEADSDDGGAGATHVDPVVQAMAAAASTAARGAAVTVKRADGSVVAPSVAAAAPRVVNRNFHNDQWGAEDDTDKTAKAQKDAGIPDKLPDGRHTVTLDNGDVYDGDVKVQQMDGRGTMKYHGGATYDGEWAQNQRHGQGTYAAPDGASYAGTWVHDVKEGACVVTLANGDRYEGDVARGGKYHGRGKWLAHDGKSYDGDWLDGAKHGRGQQRQTNGDVYKGEFVKGKPHGKGVCRYETKQATFTGEWNEGNKVAGHMQTDAGRVVKGPWREEDVVVPDDALYDA